MNAASESLRLSYYVIIIPVLVNCKIIPRRLKANAFFLFRAKCGHFNSVPHNSRSGRKNLFQAPSAIFLYSFWLTISNRRIVSLLSPNLFSVRVLWMDLPIPRCLRYELLLVLPIDRRGMVIAMIINGNNRMANKAGLVSVEDREVVRRRQESGSHSIQSHPRFTGHHPGRIRATLRWLFCNMKRWPWRENPQFVAVVLSAMQISRAHFVIFFSIRRLNRNYLQIPNIRSFSRTYFFVTIYRRRRLNLD